MTRGALALEEGFARLDLALGRRSDGTGAAGDEHGNGDRQQQHSEADGDG
jgi:hypothetical protein